MARQRLDADRLAAAYERDGRRLLVFFTRRTYDAQLAVDLVAETYARAFEQRRRFAADATDHDALAGWVFGIGRNVLHETLRRGRAERRALARLGVDPPALEAEEQIRIEELAALGELRSAVQGALAELGPEQREAVRLRIVDELGYPADRGAPGRLRADGQGARVARAASAGGSGRPSRDRGAGSDVSARDPDAILAELGDDLRAAWARPPRRALFARWPRGLVLVLALLALVPTALATRDAIWAPDPAPLPDAARPPGSFAPQRTGAQVYVAAGAERGVAWRLTASACDYGRLRAVGVFLTVPGGGGGARCDIASRRARRGREPERPRAAPGADLLRSGVGTHVGLRRAAGRGEHGRRDERGCAHARRRDAR